MIRSAVRQSYDLLWEINKFRRINGLNDLALNPNLSNSAQWMARDLSLMGRVSHIDSKGGNAANRAQRFGYDTFWTIRENIAAGITEPREVLDAWKKSKGHRENLLARGVSQVGVGYAYDVRSPHHYYWVIAVSDGSTMR